MVGLKSFIILPVSLFCALFLLSTQLLVSNISPRQILDVDIKVKKLKRQTNFLESKYDELISNKRMHPNSIVQ